LTSVAQETYGFTAPLDVLWGLLKAQLTTAETLALLNGGKVYLGTENFAAPEGPLTQPWGRQVIIPSTTLWPATLADSSYRGVSWVVRSEMQDYKAPAGQIYDAGKEINRLQQIAAERLVGWAPAASSGLLVRLATWIQRPPQGMPEYDGDRKMWWDSSEFRCEVTRV
jgi:hypothetical protein